MRLLFTGGLIPMLKCAHNILLNSNIIVHDRQNSVSGCLIYSLDFKETILNALNHIYNFVHFFTSIEWKTSNSLWDFVTMPPWQCVITGYEPHDALNIHAQSLCSNRFPSEWGLKPILHASNCMWSSLLSQNQFSEQHAPLRSRSIHSEKFACGDSGNQWRNACELWR